MPQLAWSKINDCLPRRHGKFTCKTSDKICCLTCYLLAWAAILMYHTLHKTRKSSECTHNCVLPRLVDSFYLHVHVRACSCTSDAIHVNGCIFNIPANGSKYYGGLIAYCSKAWDIHLDCVMKVGVVMVMWPVNQLVFQIFTRLDTFNWSDDRLLMNWIALASLTRSCYVTHCRPWTSENSALSHTLNFLMCAFFLLCGQVPVDSCGGSLQGPH